MSNNNIFPGIFSTPTTSSSGGVTSVDGVGGDTEEYIAVTGGPITSSGTLTVDLLLW